MAYQRAMAACLEGGCYTVKWLPQEEFIFLDRRHKQGPALNSGRAPLARDWQWHTSFCVHSIPHKAQRWKG
jgi:hypothetical protein